jgi:hypothetical protein
MPICIYNIVTVILWGLVYIGANKLLANKSKDSKQSMAQYLLTWFYSIRKFNAIMRKVNKSSLLRIISARLV